MTRFGVVNLDNVILTLYNYGDTIYGAIGDKMSKKEKLLAKMKKHPPQNDITLDEFKTFLNHCGFVHKRTNGSHHVYEMETTKKPLVFASHGLIDRATIKYTIELLQDMEVIDNG